VLQHTFCRICESLCGLEVEVLGGRVARILPDARHVATGGFACVKGLKQHQLFESSGVNANLLAADGADAIERVSGMARLTGILVEVSPAAGPRDAASWSGIAEAAGR